ncbi:hypothetical protein [Citrobacter pasteurii]
MTTNHHPAHGPVSLDRLHQISEILSKAAAQSDGGNLGYAMADAVKVIDGAIAAFGSEPTAYMYKDGDDIEYNGHNEFSGGGKGVPLYTAPPAPVVPDEKLIGSFDAEKNEIAILDKDTTVERFSHWHAHNKFEVIIRPRHTAMLQAGNSPVTGFDPASDPDRTVEVRYCAPPGYVMVPVEPTHAMINAWLSEVANWRGHVSGYKAALAAAPQQEE